MEHSYKSRASMQFPPNIRKSTANSILTGRRSLHGGIKKPNAPSSRYSISGRSTKSNQIIARSTNNVAQNFGLPLPITVNEALMFSERSTNVSINCSNNGWAWAICGRKLLIWQYKDTATKYDGNVRTPQRKPVISQCRELTLPHCDIGHKASLITVYTTEGQQMASCLSISPTGDVRFWPSIAHDALSIDETGILEGQEFDELVTISPVGYVLVTTTCNLVLLQLQLINGRHQIKHRDVRPPTSFLGGIGKKFASILIGNNPNDRENRFLRICAEISESSDWYVSVLSDRYIQRWSIELNFNETFMFEDQNIIQRIKQTFHTQYWPSNDINDIEMFIIDMQPAMGGELILLVGAMNLTHTPQIIYALITLSEQQAGFIIKNFCQIKMNAFYSGEMNDEQFKYKFILNRNASVAYVYGDREIYEVILGDIVQPGIENTEKIELPAKTDKILSATVYNQIPIFFSRLNGFISISSADFDNIDVLSSSMISDAADLHITNQSLNVEATAANLTIYDIDPDDLFNIQDNISQIKAAFIYHLKKNTAKCSNIINQLFANQNSVIIKEFDNLIVKIAKDLAEDIPAADPRWEEQIAINKYALGSSTSMQIIQQLKEKNRAFAHFIDFLQATCLWEKLDSVTDRSPIKATCHMLSDINEKIIAGIALKGIHNQYSNVIDDAIELTLKKRNEITPDNLTSQDVFYVQITRIQEFFKALATVGDEIVQQEQSSVKASQTLLDIGKIFLTVLHEVTKFREFKSSTFKLPEDKVNKFEYLPWTAASSPNGIRESLLHIINIIVKHGIRSTGGQELRQQHFKNLVELIDFYLDGRKAYLESVKDLDKYDTLLRKYETERSDLIFNFVDEGQYELAAKLAEKYLDFKTLVIICDQTKNQARLDEYIERYREQNFSQFAINWHLQQNKRGDLFERFKRNQGELARFLGDHPSLGWIQAVFNGDVSRASRILLTLAQNETESILRKKTTLSLAKLTSLASEDEHGNEIEIINNELQLIEYQLKVPQRLLTIFGFDAQNQKVLDPEEIITLYIAEENVDATEEDYQTALTLTSLVDDPIDVKHKIWCSAILRDDWNTYNVNAPLETVQNFMFYKLIDLCLVLFVDLDEFLPPLQEILDAPELGSLTKNRSFQFLLKLIYEYFIETYRKSSH